MITGFDGDLRPQFAIAQPVFVCYACTRMDTNVQPHATEATLLANCSNGELCYKGRDWHRSLCKDTSACQRITRCITSSRVVEG
jgi:hypothetical protein